ncbi:ZN395-like protein [Mya arenaria]|uniref:ZN395-like protein n=1 Tax=Mya arenaria TaxID=6604 RepID=A0ABY7F567_MYAAR|nr:ZN395-like protein [Mya arenaria]
MFGSRRLAKRSIVGTRVAAKWQDGRYYAGVIKGVYAEETPFTDAVYTILFEDGYEKSTPSKSIVGPGFQPCSTCVLKKGQKAFLTLNGREISGTVINHATDMDEVLLNVQLVNGDEIDIIKRIDEVRLLKSRKSARLQDQDTDYSKMADLQLTEARKRTVSSGIDMPSKSVQHGYRTIHLADDTDGNTNGTVGSDESSEDVEMMDENIAALVLTSLSCSPQSPQFTAQDFRDFTRNGHLSSSVASSGFHSNQSEHSDPSPPTPSHLSESAPATTSAIQKKTMYQCTWPGCNKISATCEAIEKHVRDTHLGSDTENEEDFYYTEIEVNVDNVTRGFSDMCTSASSPPATGSAPATPSFVIPDHDYQKKEFRQVFASSVPSTSAFLGHTHAMPIPIKVSEIQRSLSWQNTHTYATSPSPPIRISNRPSPQERLQQHQAQSPKLHTGFPTSKSLSIHKKPRSEVRKCRKVYGMDNRDMWCTQCKWKKACTRFLD